MAREAYLSAWRSSTNRLSGTCDGNHPKDGTGQRAFRFLLRWAGSWCFDILTGFGETPQKPIAVGATVCGIVFPLIFWAIGALPDHAGLFRSTSPFNIDWSDWWDSLLLSFASFGTITFNRIQPENDVGTLIAAIEAFTGVLLFALFVFTLGNRMSRS